MTEHDPVIGECLRDSVKKREISEKTEEEPRSLWNTLAEQDWIQSIQYIFNTYA